LPFKLLPLNSCLLDKGIPGLHLTQQVLIVWQVELYSHLKLSPLPIGCLPLLCLPC
jgi:hypothetical protein